jgi:hypothetical protein
MGEDAFDYRPIEMDRLYEWIVVWVSDTLASHRRDGWTGVDSIHNVRTYMPTYITPPSVLSPFHLLQQQWNTWISTPISPFPDHHPGLPSRVSLVRSLTRPLPRSDFNVLSPPRHPTRCREAGTIRSGESPTTITDHRVRTPLSRSLVVVCRDPSGLTALYCCHSDDAVTGGR